MPDNVTSLGDAVLQSNLQSYFTDMLSKPAEYWQENDQKVKKWEEEQDRALCEKTFLRCGASKHVLEKIDFKNYEIITNNWEQKTKMEIFRGCALSYLEELKKGSEKNMILCGQPGVGKTFTALCILKELCKTKKDLSQYPAEWGIKGYKSGIYRTADYLCEEVKQSQSYSAKVNKFKLIDSYATTDLLIIDEIGRAESKNEADVLFSVFDRRYQEGMPSILISNKNYVDLQKDLGDALADRLNANSVILDETYFKGYPQMRNRRKC